MITNERKEQTLNAIIEADSIYYKSQCASHVIVNDVLDQMINDPIWAEAITDFMSDEKNKKKTVKVGYNRTSMLDWESNFKSVCVLSFGLIIATVNIIAFLLTK